MLLLRLLGSVYLEMSDEESVEVGAAAAAAAAGAGAGAGAGVDLSDVMGRLAVDRDG